MKRILIPTDFSETSKKAIEFSLNYFEKESLQIELVNAIPIPQGVDSELGFVGASNVMQDTISDLRKASDLTLTRLALNYPKENVTFVKKVVLGSFLEWVKTCLGDSKPDLIVLGTDGASGLHEFFIGSNAQKVVRYTNCPVISIPSSFDSTEHNNDIIIEYEATSMNKEMVSVLKDLGVLTDRKVHFLRILTPHDLTGEEEVKDSLQRLINDSGIKNHTINLVRSFNPIDGILEYCNHIKANMIVLFTHGRVGLAGLLNESVTEGVVNHSSIPVLSVNLNNIEYRTEIKERVA